MCPFVGAVLHFLECAKSLGLRLPFGIAEVGRLSWCGVVYCCHACSLIPKPDTVLMSCDVIHREYKYFTDVLQATVISRVSLNLIHKYLDSYSLSFWGLCDHYLYIL